MTFSATDAAFEGFRVVRRKPMTLVFWALFYILVMALSFAVIGGGIANLMALAESLESGGASSVDDLVPLGQAYLSILALVLPLGLVAGAVLNAAVARSVLRPQESAFGYLRLGMDEVRVLVVTLVLSILFSVCMGVLAVLVGFVFGLAGSSGSGAAWFGGLVVVLALIAAAIWLAVRFSMAIPITIAERKMAFFDSFRATKGRFWGLFGMAVIAFIMAILVSLLGMVVFMPLQLTVGGLEQLSAYEGQNLGAMLQAAWPAIAAWIVIQSVISALQLAVVYAPFSAAYRDLFGDRPDKVFE